MPKGSGAVLPCYWIYWEVGKELQRRGSPDARYQRWIDMYGSDAFGQTVQDVLAVADKFGPASRRASARWCIATSARRAATNGCSGTWASISSTSVAGSAAGRGRGCRSAREPSLTIRSVAGAQPVTNG